MRYASLAAAAALAVAACGDDDDRTTTARDAAPPPPEATGAETPLDGASIATLSVRPAPDEQIDISDPGAAEQPAEQATNNADEVAQLPESEQVRSEDLRQSAEGGSSNEQQEPLSEGMVAGADTTPPTAGGGVPEPMVQAPPVANPSAMGETGSPEVEPEIRNRSEGYIGQTAAEDALPTTEESVDAGGAGDAARANAQTTPMTSPSSESEDGLLPDATEAAEVDTRSPSQTMAFGNEEGTFGTETTGRKAVDDAEAQRRATAEGAGGPGGEMPSRQPAEIGEGDPPVAKAAEGQPLELQEPSREDSADAAAGGGSQIGEFTAGSSEDANEPVAQQSEGETTSRTMGEDAAPAGEAAAEEYADDATVETGGALPLAEQTDAGEGAAGLSEQAQSGAGTAAGSTGQNLSQPMQEALSALRSINAQLGGLEGEADDEAISEIRSELQAAAEAVARAAHRAGVQVDLLAQSE